MSIVSKEEYWTTILNDYSQFGQITTEDSEFNSIANDVWNVLENSFIKIDDEESIIKWEEMTGLSGEGLTIFQRKVNILYTLTVKNYLPISLFTQAMDRLVGEDNYIITFNEDTQKYEVECYEDYETSASFLNKRLSNESVELETTSLPLGYLAAEFLESTGTQYISTAWKPLTETTENLEAGFIADHQVLSGTRAPLGLVYSNSTFGLTSTSVGGAVDVYFGRRIRYYDTGAIQNQRMRVQLNYKNSRKLEITAVTETRKQDLTVQAISAVIRNPMPLFTTRTQDAAIYTPYSVCRIWSAVFTEGSKVVHSFSAALTDKGIPCMYDKVNKATFTNSGTGQFIVGMTCKQALKLGRLPKTGGSLTVSLPWEAQLVQHNAEVEAALQTAKANGWTITVQYRDPEPDNVVYNKYAECTNMLQVSQVNAEWWNDVTVDGQWIYPLTNAISLYDNANFGYLGFFETTPATSVTVYAPKLTNAHYLFCANKKTKKVHINVPSLTSSNYMFYNSIVEEVDGDLSKLVMSNFFFRGNSALRKFRCPLPSYKGNDVTAFAAAQLDKESAINILTSIPAVSSCNIGIGIHVDHQNDEEVAAAVADAEAKGWIVSVAWHGTATTQAASALGLRREPVYAKVVDMVGIDGTTEQILAWGHYVTNWEENSYQEFASVEEAKEHFNISE